MNRPTPPPLAPVRLFPSLSGDQFNYDTIFSWGELSAAIFAAYNVILAQYLIRKHIHVHLSKEGDMEISGDAMRCLIDLISLHLCRPAECYLVCNLPSSQFRALQ